MKKNPNLYQQSPPLENAFLSEHDEDLAELFKQINENQSKHHEEEQRLRSVSGIESPSVLTNAVELGVTEVTFSALALVPLIHVAWADHKSDEKERKIILQAAEQMGVKQGSTAHQLLEYWLQEEYNPNLTITWKNYVQVLAEKMPRVEFLELKKEILKKCRKVAKASGGFMGVSKITKPEERVIQQIEDTFNKSLQA